jgi:hypothetical protein
MSKLELLCKLPIAYHNRVYIVTTPAWDIVTSPAWDIVTSPAWDIVTTPAWDMDLCQPTCKALY